MDFRFFVAIYCSNATALAPEAIAALADLIVSAFFRPPAAAQKGIATPKLSALKFPIDK
jgi:hypothetical protein